MGQNNKNLNKAQWEVNDEFYTLYDDVEKMVKIFKKEYYKDKIIYCPFDSDESNFVKYFKDHKDDLQYKELLYTWDDYKNHHDLFLKADIIISNPPFSIFIGEITPYICNLIHEKNNVSHFVGAQLTAAQLTAAKLTAAVLTALPIDDDLKIKCTNLYIQNFLTPNGEIKRVPTTSLVFCTDESIIEPGNKEPDNRLTLQECKDKNAIQYFTIKNFNQNIGKFTYLNKLVTENYKDFIGKKFIHFKNRSYIPKDFHGYALCPITSILNMKLKNRYDDMIFNEYGWEVRGACNVHDDEGKEKFMKILIYHE